MVNEPSAFKPLKFYCITNLRFPDDIDALAEEEQEIEALVESHDKTYIR